MKYSLRILHILLSQDIWRILKALATYWIILSKPDRLNWYTIQMQASKSKLEVAENS